MVPAPAKGRHLTEDELKRLHVLTHGESAMCASHDRGELVLNVAPSWIEDAGLGLFLTNFGRTTTAVEGPITLYGGFLVGPADAERLQERKQDTHLRTLTRQWLHVDGNFMPVHGAAAAGFVNDPRSKSLYNAELVACRVNPAWLLAAQVFDKPLPCATDVCVLWAPKRLILPSMHWIELTADYKTFAWNGPAKELRESHFEARPLPWIGLPRAAWKSEQVKFFNPLVPIARRLLHPVAVPVVPVATKKRGATEPKKPKVNARVELGLVSPVLRIVCRHRKCRASTPDYCKERRLARFTSGNVAPPLTRLARPGTW